MVIMNLPAPQNHSKVFQPIRRQDWDSAPAAFLAVNGDDTASFHIAKTTFHKNFSWILWFRCALLNPCARPEFPEGPITGTEMFTSFHTIQSFIYRNVLLHFLCRFVCKRQIDFSRSEWREDLSANAQPPPTRARAVLRNNGAEWSTQPEHSSFFFSFFFFNTGLRLLQFK